MKKNWRTCQAWILAVSLGVSSLSGLGWQTEEAQAQDTLTAQEELLLETTQLMNIIV